MFNYLSWSYGNTFSWLKDFSNWGIGDVLIAAVAIYLIIMFFVSISQKKK